MEALGGVLFLTLWLIDIKYQKKIALCDTNTVQ